MSSNIEKLMDMAAKGAYQLLQHHVCRDYKTSQRGNKMGGVHHRHNAHRLYLIPKMEETEHVKTPSDDDVSPHSSSLLLIPHSSLTSPHSSVPPHSFTVPSHSSLPQSLQLHAP